MNEAAGGPVSSSVLYLGTGDVRARMFDKHGKDEECLRVIDQAKQLMAH
jgi:hypothetical protein